MNAVSSTRPLVSVKKLEKMIDRLQRMVRHLDTTHDIGLHRRVSQAYFMQKAEELKFLKAQLEEAIANLQRVQNLVDEHYPPVYEIWRRDVRSLVLYGFSPKTGKSPTIL